MRLTIRGCTLLLFVILSVSQIHAQSAYSMHTLAQGETLSKLAKDYHTTVGDIMRMNGMNAQSQLKVGDKIKIPADGTTVTRETPVAGTSVATATPASTPKTHVVAAGETLYHISQVYKVPVDKLIALNNLPDGSVKVGQTLLLRDNGTSSTASLPPSKPRVETPTVTQQSSTPAVKETRQPVTTPQPVTTESAPVGNAQTQKESPTQPASKPVDNTPVASSTTNAPVDYSTASNAPKDGFFSPMYGKDAQQQKEQTKSGNAMTFKSASGWADKKYYILMNDAPTGSIVKISNGKNQLYAKVLWSLGEMKENEGLSFRISTAAAAALGITDQKFDLKVSYYE